MKLQLKRSLRLSNGAAQAPSAEQMSYGEIAVNYSDTDPSIFLKDSSNVIRKLAISSLPDTSSSSAQSGTLDDRYLMLSGGTVSGDVSATNFLGGVARVATSAPATGSESELWFNSSTGRLYIRYSGQWVDASPDSFTMGTDFYSKTQADSAIATAVTALENGAVATNSAAITALENGQVATNTTAIAGLTSDIAAEESARLAAEADKMDVAGGTFTGPVSFNEDVIVKGGAGGSGEITLNCENNSHGVKLKGPAHSAGANYTLTLPTSTGNSGEVLTTDGSGAMSWEEVVGNEISASAPTSPSQGALWTDTSEDPAAPILKTWNGSSWVAVGSAAPSEFAPVIDSVTLTENDPTGDRFTSQSFDVDINMLVEGSPHSQKALKGEVTADFSVYPASEPVSSNAVTTFPNNNRTYGYESWQNYGMAPVYATDNLGRGVWYFLIGYDSNLVLAERTPGTNNSWSQVANATGYYTSFRRAQYISNSGTYQYIYTVTERRDNTAMVRGFRRPTNGTGDWQAWSPGYEMSPPIYDEQYDVWWYSKNSGNTRTVRKGTTHLSNNLGETSNSSTSGRSSGQMALGSDRLVVTRRNSNSGMVYSDVYRRDAGQLYHLGSGTIIHDNGDIDLLAYAGGVFFATSAEYIWRSTDGFNWTSSNIDSSPGEFWVDQIVYNSTTGNIEAYGLDVVSSTMEMWTSNNGGITWVQAFNNSVSSTQRGENVSFGGNKVLWHGYRSGNYQEYSFPRNEQTITLSGTGADYSSFNVGDLIKPEGSTNVAERGRISSISGADIGVVSEYIYQVGDKIEAVYPTNSSVSTRYLVIDATGAVSGTVGSDPGYVEVGPDTNQTLTFPATFATGDSPDDELGAGTYIKVSAQATNSQGSSEFGPSNIVTPS